MWILPLFVFVIGVMIGSYLNVLIYRLPRELDTVFARSSCPSCGKLIPWYENIPVISYLVLRGKCSGCKTKISIKYPLVELICGLVAVLMINQFYPMEKLLNSIFLFSIFCAFLTHFLVDVEFQILPNQINLYLLIISIAYTFIYGNWTISLWGGGLGLLIPLAVSWLYYLRRGQYGMGGGDIKLFGILGILLGPKGVFLNIFLSCFLGVLIFGGLIIAKGYKKDTPMAFGPSIIIVASIQLFLPHYFRVLERILII